MKKYSNVVIGSLILILCVGCTSMGMIVGKMKGKIPGIGGKEQVDKYPDDVDISKIKIKGPGCDTLHWEKKSDLVVKWNGPCRVHLEQSISDQLPSVENVAATCWFAMEDGHGGWYAYSWDYMRANNKHRDFPCHPPKHGESYPTAKINQRVLIWVAGLSRDRRRNGKIRSAIKLCMVGVEYDRSAFYVLGNQNTGEVN